MSFLNQLAQSLINAPAKSTRLLFDGSLVLSTDIGLVRKENQDRLACARIATMRDSEAVYLVAVSDGMGGMANGGECATVAIATLIDAVRSFATAPDLREIMERAAHKANEAVYEVFHANGGATLSALAWRGTEVVTLNVGDSRIYHQARDRSEGISRLTIDDTMQEAFGSEGKGLIQFIGIGRGLKPHVQLIERQGALIATTDGIHFIDPSLFTDILHNATAPKSKAERLTALSRWLGGPDNASMFVVDFENFRDLPKPSEPKVELWTCASDTLNVWLQLMPEIDQTPQRPTSADPEPHGSKLRKTKNSRRKSKNDKPEQLEIEINLGDEHADSE